MDLHGRPSLDLLGLSYQYVPGYRGGAKARLAVRSGEANLNVTGLANYRGNLSAQVKEGSAKGLWYYPFLDAKGNPVKLASVPEMPHFLEVYEKVKGGQPSGPAWEVLKMLLEFRSIATHMALMPPGTDKQAVDAIRAGFGKLLASDDVKTQQQKVLQFVVEPIPVSVAEQRIADLSSFDPRRLATLKSYIATGRKK